MTIDWQRIKQLLNDAAAQTLPAERAAYLDSACMGDALLRAQVDQLLQAHDQAGAFLDPPLFPPAEWIAELPLPLTEKAGDNIGPYRLLQQIGEGGCGVVYMAEQEHPIRRRVALKIIKLGMDTKAVVARFEAERQALALMDHPNIARVLDAGSTETGRPYFVMELVRGIRITDYCDQNRLSTEQRLRLFTQVCHAIQHAHQKGIIHRDIKPSNILVTLHDGAPTPKVIDFGIAKATDQRLTHKTQFTAFEQFIGTPAYMSPEQAQMSTLDIDTRSDIYSLGVLLYELLTGQTPFDHKELIAAGLDEMRRIILKQEPKRPSTRLSTLTAADQTAVARYRQSEPQQLVHLVRGDLDWIVTRCLEKDRTRRYETANSLADDISRHLNNEPVTARPPRRLYRFQKLVQRNKATFAAVGMVAAALVLGLGFSLWTLSKEREARQQTLAAEKKAHSEASKSRQVAQFLKDMLQGVGPSAALGRDTTMLREILDKTALGVGKDLKGQPEVEAELRITLGEVYQALGQYDQAERMYREALAIQRTLWGNMNTNVADSLDRLGHELRSCKSELVESASLMEQAFMIRTNLLGPEHVQVAASLYHLGGVQLYEGSVVEAFDLFRRSLAMRRRFLGNEHLEVAQSLTALSDTSANLENPEEGEAYAREALAILARIVPDERASLAVASAEEALSTSLRQSKPAESVALLRNVVAIRKNLLGSEHPDTANALLNLAMSLQKTKQLGEAEAAVRDALAVSRKTVGEQHRRTAFCVEKLGDILRSSGRFSEAEDAYREALAIWKTRENRHHQRVLTNLTGLLRAQQHFDEAQAVLSEAAADAREALEIARRQPPSEASVNALLRLLDLQWRLGPVSEAEHSMAETLEIARQIPSSASLVEKVSFHAMKHAAIELSFGREADYTALCRQMIQWAGDQPKFAPKGRAAAMVNLRQQTDPQLRASALFLARQAVGAAPTNSFLPWYQLTMGVAEYRSGHYSEALHYLSTSERGVPVRITTARLFRAMILFHQDQRAVARQLFAEAEVQPVPAKLQQALAEGADYDQLVLWLAYREAHALLTSP